MNILIIGSGGREHALARAFARSRQNPNLFCFGSSQNPGISDIAKGYQTGNLKDPDVIVRYAKQNNIDLAIVGPEAPLEAGVVDALEKESIPNIGPSKLLARIETSKSFARELLGKHGIDVCPRHRYFSSLDGVPEYIRELGEQYVIKADGLMGGKGVKLSGDHLLNEEEALAWCRELQEKKSGFLIEEKLFGEEFSLMSFSDGEHLVHMPIVQDHKRLLEGDSGPQTGGMGSYSFPDHKLPFLKEKDIQQARKTNERTVHALGEEFNKPYKGILYGGFMAVKNGVMLIEYNARFGDPEGINVLALLESDLLEICLAIIEGNLSPKKVRFSSKATVCKYAVPEGHPLQSEKNAVIELSPKSNKDRLYLAGIDERSGKWHTTGSRAIASLGIADSIEEAERIAEAEIGAVKGPLIHRSDIGTRPLIEKRIAHMRRLRDQA